MTEEDRRYLVTAAKCVDRLLAARTGHPLQPHGLTPELQAFAERFDQLLEALEALRQFSITLGNGDLTREPPPGLHLLDPLKQLHANLRHLTWQTQRIAAGDLDQQVDFLGEFSHAFNRMIGVLRDKQAAEDRIRYLSEHDSLTGLYNRAYFDGILERLHAEGACPVSLVVADLDGLKKVNDTLGHHMGDLLIQKAAQVLQQGLEPQGILARIGGDEFVMILPGTDADQAAAAIARIRGALEAFNQRDPLFPIAFSLGVATASHPSALMGALRQADHAMYQEKRARKESTSAARLRMGSG